MHSREGPHEAHRRMVLSVQRQQLLDAGSQHPPQFNQTDGLSNANNLYNIHEAYEQRRPMTQGHEGPGVRRARANQMLMVSIVNY